MINGEQSDLGLLELMDDRALQEEIERLEAEQSRVKRRLWRCVMILGLRRAKREGSKRAA